MGRDLNRSPGPLFRLMAGVGVGWGAGTVKMTQN